MRTSVLQDIRFALRMLAKDRWYTLVAVIALGLGIGLNATVFTFVNAVLIRGLPFHHPEQILHVSGRNTATRNGSGISFLDYQEFRAQAKTFAGLAAYRGGNFTITESGRPPERIQGVFVSANTFSLLGQAPLHGRTFAEGEDSKEAAPVALVGYGTWQSRYGGDPGLVGRVIKVNDVACTVIGIMPERMKFPNNAELWRPLVPEEDDLVRGDNRSLNLFGRLAPGVSRREAETEMSGIAARLEQQYAESNKNMGVEVMTFNERFNGGPIRAVFLALLGAVGFVLLIACANVANLLLARSATRTREVAVRFALGASRGRVVRQLLVESVLLACLGGLLGLGLAQVSVSLFEAAVANVGKPYWIVFSFDPVVFGYFAAICLTTGIIFGLAPALQVSRTNMNEVLKEGGRGTAGTIRARRLTSTMVVAEVALTLVLLVGAGLMIRSFLKLYSFNLGIETAPILTLRMQLPTQKYPKPEERRIFYDTLMVRLQAIPGLQAAAIASAIPFGGSEGRALEIEGRPPAKPEDAPRTSTITISPTYFDVMGISMRRGRGFADADGASGSETAIVNERFVARFFAGEDALGKRIRLVSGRPPTLTPGPWLTIVGVSPTIRQGNPQSVEPDAVVYRPYRLEAPGFMNIITRSQVPATSLTPLVRTAVQRVDPDLPVFQVQTLDEFLAQGRWPYRVFGSMFTIFAVIALVLSAVGIYAVTAYSVTQRMPEIGVRMALGARAAQVSWLILKGGLLQLAIGLGLGLPLAAFASKALESLVVQIPARDPLTFGIIVGLLVVVTLAACLVPAWRATRLDPLRALRVE
jgi:putative ABC transport system permease protein